MKIKVFIMVLIFLFNGVCFAGSGNTSGNVLLEDIGARSVGLAGACTSLSGDVILMHYNPASLADITDPQLAAMFYNSGLTGVNYISVAYGQKFGKIGTFGICVGYLDGGQMDLNYTDGITATVTSEQDIVANVSMGINLSRKINAGVSLKGMYSTLVNTQSEITAALDLGAIFKGLFMEEIAPKSKAAVIAL